MINNWTIYCDESIENGKFYSDFFGGVLVGTKNVERISRELNDSKHQLNLFKEIKWTKTSDPYLSKYIAMMDIFFDYILRGDIKMRVMFRRTEDKIKVSRRADKNRYFKLYYQFIKHAFGLKYMPESDKTVLKIFLDELPESKQKSNIFKNYLVGLQNLTDFEHLNLSIDRRDVVDIDSKHHVILQCLDIVLGSMAFKLNKLDKAVPEGKARRGRKTIAKEKLYKHIRSRIIEIYPNFNVGGTTGKKGDISNYFHHPYRHWKFTPNEILQSRQ
jgi:hypothetical protein